MSERGAFTRPVTGPAASLHADRQRRQVREEGEQFRPSQLLPQHGRPVGADSVRLEHVPGQNQPNRGNFHSGLFSVVERCKHCHAKAWHGDAAKQEASTSSSWCTFPDVLRSWSGGFRGYAGNWVDLLLVDLREGLDHHVAAGSLPFVVLLEQGGADEALYGGFIRENSNDVGSALHLFVLPFDGIGNGYDDPGAGVRLRFLDRGVCCEHPGQRHREHESAGRPMHSMSRELDSPASAPPITGASAKPGAAMPAPCWSRRHGPRPRLRVPCAPSLSASVQSADTRSPLSWWHASSPLSAGTCSREARTTGGPGQAWLPTSVGQWNWPLASRRRRATSVGRATPTMSRKCGTKRCRSPRKRRRATSTSLPPGAPDHHQETSVRPPHPGRDCMGCPVALPADTPRFATRSIARRKNNRSPSKNLVDLIRRVQFRAVLPWKGHVGQHVMFAGVHQVREFRPSGPQLLRHLAPSLARMGRSGWSKACRNEPLSAIGPRTMASGRDHRVLAAGHMRQGVAHPMDPTALPRGLEDPRDGGLQAGMGVADHQPHAIQAAGLQRAQELGREGLGLRGPQPQADDFPPPPECGFGVSPSQADRSRDVRKPVTSGSVAASAVAVIGPMPGMLRSLFAASLVSASRRMSLVSAPILARVPEN